MESFWRWYRFWLQQRRWYRKRKGGLWIYTDVPGLIDKPFWQPGMEFYGDSWGEVELKREVWFS